MLIFISPAKTLNESYPPSFLPRTSPLFKEESDQIIKQLQTFSPEHIMHLMKVSDKIATLNYERFQNWFNDPVFYSAVCLFKGDTYQGLDISSWDLSKIDYSQDHLRILSGLYGVLKPLDETQAYRLEMGRPIEIKSQKSPAQFWKSQLINPVNHWLEENNDNYIVNLASQEYFSAMDFNKLNAPVLTPIFLDYTNGKYKVVSFYAKKARGAMASFIIENQIKKKEDLISFNSDGYSFDKIESRENFFVFKRHLS